MRGAKEEYFTKYRVQPTSAKHVSFPRTRCIASFQISFFATTRKLCKKFKLHHLQKIPHFMRGAKEKRCTPYRVKPTSAKHVSFPRIRTIASLQIRFFATTRKIFKKLKLHCLRK